MNDFRKLDIWERSKKICVPVYSLTEKYPKSELYGITSQIRRCSVSISSNIAEGSSRRSVKEYYHFVSIALGSAYELETQLDISYDLKFIGKAELKEIKDELIEIQKMIYNFMNYLSKKF